jgi:hypothetical protein
MRAAPATDTAFVPAAFELLPMLTVATLVVDDPGETVDSVTRHGALRTLRRITGELGVAVVLAT